MSDLATVRNLLLRHPAPHVRCRPTVVASTLDLFIYYDSSSDATTHLDAAGLLPSRMLLLLMLLMMLML